MTLYAGHRVHLPDAEAMMVALFIGCGTFIYYGLHDLYTKIWEGSSSKPGERKSFWQQNYKWLLALMAVTSIVALYWGWQICTPFRFWVYLVAGIITLLYSFPLLPFPRLRRWKEQPVIKLIVLSGVWAAICTVIVLPTGNAWSRTIEWLFFLRWSFMVAICLPFEVRDTEFDKSLMKKTLPDILQYRGLIVLLIICLLVYLAMLGIGWHQQWVLTAPMLVGVMHILYIGWLVYKSLRSPQHPFMYLWLDAQIILQPLIIGAGIVFT